MHWQTLEKILEHSTAPGYCTKMSRRKPKPGKYRPRIRQIRQRSTEVFVPLVHRPGEAQFDFGFALPRIGGVLTSVVFSVMALRYSDAFFVQAFPRIATEVLWEAPRRELRLLLWRAVRITYSAASAGATRRGSPRRR
jgi:hypothetical protein